MRKKVDRMTDSFSKEKKLQSYTTEQKKKTIIIVATNRIIAALPSSGSELKKINLFFPAKSFWRDATNYYFSEPNK